MTASTLKETPSQTAGPFLHIGTVPATAGLRTRPQECLNVLANAATAGERIVVEGVIHDGAGAPVTDALLEIWQAGADGRYGAAGFPGWGRAAADFTTGLFRFETIKPGATRARDGRPQAPHVSISIFARGINIHLQTRMYFPEETAANKADPVLQAVAQPDLIATLISRKETKPGAAVYRFDIYLQGDRETVFFDF
ncbi:MAG TPA: protocatechuate 3,4-dioxygenase subunit alpha [Verrucomicrobiae bacterium]|nr:protocatechuate 3,4-dioxygenase subunit alpha [Verrucomicrobiae bacterium]